MAIERTWANGKWLIHLMECPACGFKFGQHSNRSRHIEQHDPEDFGLSPIGSRPEAKAV